MAAESLLSPLTKLSEVRLQPDCDSADKRVMSHKLNPSEGQALAAVYPLGVTPLGGKA